jgi:hypothetical protein
MFLLPNFVAICTMTFHLGGNICVAWPGCQTKHYGEELKLCSFSSDNTATLISCSDGEGLEMVFWLIARP